MSDLPLAGVTVLEFSHAVLGPTAGMILADLGAEVVKIEPAPAGDPTRFLKGFGQGYFPYFNRNKKSLVLDLKKPEGRQVVERLLGRADVLLENYGPGTIERLGLGYAELKNRFPRLVFCSLKGFLSGPYERRIALDEVVQMMSGLAYMTGPPGQPLRAGASIIDMTTGMYGAMGVILALRERDRSGRGQFVRSALFETAAFLMGHHMATAVASGEPLPPMPERVSAWAVYHQFDTADGQRLFLGVTSDKQWPRFCRAFERPDLLADERLRTNNERIAQRDWLLPELRALIRTLPLAEAVRRCEEAALPFSPIARPEDLFADPQLGQGAGLYEVDFPDGPHGKLPRLPLELGEQALPLRRHPPLLAEHSREILTSLGYTQADIRRLAREGVVVLAADEARAPAAPQETE